MNLKNIELSAKTKNILIKKYPNKLTRIEKIEVANVFFRIYKLKLYSTIMKNPNKSFQEINRMTLISLTDQKANKNGEYFKYMNDSAVVKIDKTITECFSTTLNDSKEIVIDDEISLIKNGRNIEFK